jgi:hypothetical protein
MKSERLEVLIKRLSEIHSELVKMSGEGTYSKKRFRELGVKGNEIFEEVKDFLPPKMKKQVGGFFRRLETFPAR